MIEHIEHIDDPESSFYDNQFTISHLNIYATAFSICLKKNFFFIYSHKDVQFDFTTYFCI